MNKNVWVVPYHKDLGKIGYTMHYSERKARKWGFKHLAKTGENFSIIKTTEAEALKMR